MRSIYGVITVFAMTGCIPEYFQNFSANGQDGQALPSSNTLNVELDAAYTTVASSSVEAELPTVPFHGLSCPSGDALSWAATDLCMGDPECDLVTFSVGCDLVDVLEGELHVCLARDDAGDWGLCPDVLGVDEDEVWSLMEDAFDYDGRYDIEPRADLADCMRVAEAATVVDIDEVGIRFMMGGMMDHVACATDEPGEWGGKNPLGTVYFPILKECVEPLIEDGWMVAYSEASGGHVVMGESFTLDLVLTGKQADL